MFGTEGFEPERQGLAWAELSTAAGGGGREKAPAQRSAKPSRASGVCNFYPERLTDLCLNVKIPPMVNQVELHPFFAQDGAIANMRDLGVQPEAWGPLAEGQHGIFTHPVLTEIGERYGKTAAQVALRWNAQRGVAVIPKSTHRERMEENFNIWDFRLSEEEMAAIGALDLGRSEIIDHSTAERAKFLNGWKIHD